MYDTYFIYKGEVWTCSHLGDANVGAKGTFTSGGMDGSFTTKEEAEKKLNERK